MTPSEALGYRATMQRPCAARLLAMLLVGAASIAAADELAAINTPFPARRPIDFVELMRARL